MPESRFEVYRGHGGRWRFRLIARNNEIISVGQGYKSKQGCLRGIKSIKKNAGDAPIFHREEGEEIKNLEEIEPIKEDESVLVVDVTGDEKFVEPGAEEPTVEESSEEGLTSKILDWSTMVAIGVAIITLVWIMIGV